MIRLLQEPTIKKPVNKLRVGRRPLPVGRPLIFHPLHKRVIGEWRTPVGNIVFFFMTPPANRDQPAKRLLSELLRILQVMNLRSLRVTHPALVPALPKSRTTLALPSVGPQIIVILLPPSHMSLFLSLPSKSVHGAFKRQQVLLDIVGHRDTGTGVPLLWFQSTIISPADHIGFHLLTLWKC